MMKSDIKELPTRTLPFLKWPGGKRWIAPLLADLVKPFLRNAYYEPFLGGAALFFELRPDKAFLSDVNGELVNAYRMVRDFPAQLESAIREIPISKRQYSIQRESIPKNRLRRAARFLYLNRTAFGGIYRLNASGEFNVPYGGGGRTPAVLWKQGLLPSASAALQSAVLRTSDFGPQIRKAGEGDVVYCDPTYTVKHDNNGFARYNERVFSWSDQIRLANEATAAADRGALVIVSNAHHEDIRALYPKYSRVVAPSRFSCLSTDTKKRTAIQEFVIVIRKR